MNILIVEDNLYDARSLADTLKIIFVEKDHDVRHLETLEEALAVLDSPEEAVDLIFLDLNSPDTEDWQEVCAKISPYTGKVPFIIMSGEENGAAAHDLLADGTSDYIVKGGHRRDARILRKAVKHAMSRHKAVEDLNEEIAQKQQVVHWLTGGYSVKNGKT